MNLTEKHYFVTGTDTGIGKTHVTCKLMRALKSEGKSVLGLKPIACGGENGHNEDALIYLQENSIDLPYAQINPYYFEAPISPHLAAHLENKKLDADEIARQMKDTLALPADHIFIEGAGGVHAPIADHKTILNLIQAFGYPVILVVGLRLGCLNHALLSMEALQSAGIKVAAWVPNPIDPNMLYQQENIETLKRIWGKILCLPYRTTPL